MKISMLGKAKGWNLANRQNTRPGEVWGINTHILSRSFDKIFNMHTERRIEIKEDGYELAIEEVRRKKIPYISLEEIPKIPTSVRFPIEEMPFIYFNSSFDYMIAYAIWYGATELQLFGCKVIQGGSHEFARPSVEFWLGYAVAKGIKVTIYPPSDLLVLRNSVLYGYEKAPADLPTLQIRRPAPAVARLTRESH